MTNPPPPGLNPKGILQWEKFGERSIFLSNDFVNSNAWLEYKDNKELSWVKSRLLEGVDTPESIDPVFLRNLCRVLNRIEEDISELDRRFR